jgi:hypothetical protein
VKRLLSQLPRKKAPDDLKDRIMQKLRETEPEFQSPHAGLAEEVAEDEPAPSTTDQPALSRKRELALRYMIGAAVVLLLCLTTIQLLDQTNIPVSFSPHVVEYHSAAHFSYLSGQSLSPHLQTSSPARAEEYIRERFGFDMTVPQLSGAEFAGLSFPIFMKDLKLLCWSIYNPITEKRSTFLRSKLIRSTRTDRSNGKKGRRNLPHSHRFSHFYRGQQRCCLMAVEQ